MKGLRKDCHSFLRPRGKTSFANAAKTVYKMEYCLFMNNYILIAEEIWLPFSFLIGHKTGTSDKNSGGEYTGINDIGFVSLPDGRRYTIAVFIKNSREKMSTNIRMIADISAAVYSYVCQSIPVLSSGSKERKN